MKLKPCPFCGSSNVQLDEAGIPALENTTCSWWIVCEDCGASGPVAEDTKFEIASEMWNKRNDSTESFMRERIELARKYGSSGDSWKPFMKLVEEIGELSEAMLVDLGSLVYKDKETCTIDEVADCLNAISAILARHYGDLSTDEILNTLNDASRRKLLKYKRKVLKIEE